MTRRTILLLLLGLAAAAPPAHAHAQAGTRSNEIGAPAEADEVTQGRFVFAGIGIDAYEHQEVWKELDNAVNDVRSIRQTLVDAFSFESPDAWVLTDGAATDVAIERLVDDLRGLGPDDNLVFFYAGHGAEVVDVVGGEEVGRTGYIVPVGAKLPVQEAPSQYIEIEDLLEDLARLPARHVLVILDSCYSGLALEGGFKTRGEAMTRQASDLISRVSRRVLTSAQSDQLAADGGADFPENSLFTGWLTEGLRRATAGGSPEAPSPDADEDGMITVTELYTFVRGRVGSDSDSRQTPDFGSFKLDNRGELVLTLESDLFDQLFRQATAAYDAGKWDEESFGQSAADALAERPEGPRSSYLRYLQATIDEDPAAELGALRELQAFADAGESIPMALGHLARELRDAQKECQRSGGCQTPGGS